MIFIADLDGTLFNNSARYDLIPADPSLAHNWHTFHAACRELDTPIMHNINVVKAFAAAGNQIIYLTSRTIATAQHTLGQLDDHGCPAGDLMMRPNDEHRSPRDYKLASVNKIVKWADYDPGAVPFIFMDDDKNVCQMIRDTFPKAVVIEVPSNDIAITEVQHVENIGNSLPAVAGTSLTLEAGEDPQNV